MSAGFAARHGAEVVDLDGNAGTVGSTTLERRSTTSQPTGHARVAAAVLETLGIDGDDSAGNASHSLHHHQQGDATKLTARPVAGLRNPLRAPGWRRVREGFQQGQQNRERTVLR